MVSLDFLHLPAASRFVDFANGAGGDLQHADQANLCALLVHKATSREVTKGVGGDLQADHEYCVCAPHAQGQIEENSPTSIDGIRMMHMRGLKEAVVEYRS